MERRGMDGMFGGLGLLFFIMMIGSPSAFAADGDGVVEAAPSHTDAGLEHATRDRILHTIDATRQTDPELAVEMERQLHLMDSGEATLTPSERDLQGGTPTAEAASGEVFGVPGGTGAPELIGPPVEGPANFEQVQSDPRMEDVRRQFEGGQLSEDQAREKVFEVLRDHGVEPNEGREWEHQGERTESMERLFEHEGERSEALREAFERELGTPERSLETPEHMPESAEPPHEYEAPPQ